MSPCPLLQDVFKKMVAKEKYWVLWNAFSFKVLRIEKNVHVLPFLGIDLKKEDVLKSVVAGVENCWIFVGIDRYDLTKFDQIYYEFSIVLTLNCVKGLDWSVSIFLRRKKCVFSMRILGYVSHLIFMALLKTIYTHVFRKICSSYQSSWGMLY